MIDMGTAIQQCPFIFQEIRCVNKWLLKNLQNFRDSQKEIFEGYALVKKIKGTPSEKKWKIPLNAKNSASSKSKVKRN